MKYNLYELNNLIKIDHRYFKRILAVTTDICFCILCTWLAFTLRLEKLVFFEDFNFKPAIISLLIAIPLFWSFGFYRTIFRYTGISIIINIFISMSVYGLIYFLIIGVYGIQGVPRSIGIIQPLLLFFAIIGSRLAAKYIMIDTNYFLKKNIIKDKENVLVYGAGEAGRQLVASLENNKKYQVIGFLDDNKTIQRQYLLGRFVYSPLYLEKLIKKKNVNLIFLAMPTINRDARSKIIDNLNQYKINVRTLPSVNEIMDGKITISDIKDLNIDDLLNRNEVQPDIKLLNKNIEGKTILVTGAGGSIGSELSRQISKLNPKKLILLELNEFALYKIYDEIISFKKNFKTIPLLVNAQDQKKLEVIFENFKVDTIYHAAAYKHVPLVEENICEGVKNNVFSSLAVVKASVKKKVSNLVLISSDKAVRPTNIMGATKRLSEICMQAIFKNLTDSRCNFSIVRFGNVLESSGSVIPKFKKQIKEGGPVTLTHPEVTRYFMTITEAAQLVIQAGAMGGKSEVFLLDMGQSIKIKDLIYKMIRLSGFSVKDEDDPSGEIEIKIIGLRPGEKLYEELLIGDNPQKTKHPKIQKASDSSIPLNILETELIKLQNLIDNNNAKEVKALLKKILNIYSSNTEIVDHIYKAKLLNKNN